MQPHFEVSLQSDRDRVESNLIVEENQSSKTTTNCAIIQTARLSSSEVGKKGREEEAMVTKDRPGVGRMETLEILNLLQLSTQTLAISRTKQAMSRKGPAQGKSLIDLGFTSNTQGDYENNRYT